MELTLEQKIIVEAPPNINLTVNACPGSGKTTVMIHRIAYMVEKYQIPLAQIAMFTYNRSLGKDMSNKLKKIGIDSSALYWCGTLHAFCYQSTQNYQDLKPWIDNITGRTPAGHNPTYQSNDLKYIIFDEYQDAETDIADVIKILSKDRYLMIVGDNRQQLYGYRGANVDHLLSIKDNFKEYTLSESFRCNKNICKFLNRIWADGDKISHTVIHSQINGPRPILYRSKGNAMNNPHITDEIVKLIEKFKEGSIAIISPTVNSDTSKRFLNDIQSNIYNHCGLLFESSFQDRRKSDNDISKYVISSIHESKGLEYDTVILLNAIDNKYFFDVPTYEARCKLFVACSRPRQNLFIFEHHYHFMNGSIKWISDNEDFFDHPEDLIWNKPIKIRNYEGSGRSERNCRDFIRGLSNQQRRTILSAYEDPKIVSAEEGLGTAVGHPALCGELIEILYAVKLGFPIRYDIKVFLTSAEWGKIITSKEIPDTVIEKIKIAYPYKHINITRKIEGSKVKITILFIDNRKRINLEPSDLDTLVEIRNITENDIVSNYMCNTYYKHLSAAVEIRQKILSSDKIDEKYISDLWWLLRFKRLMEMSILGFNQRNLNKEEILRVLSYIHKSNILTKYNITKYHPTYKKVISFDGDDSDDTCVVGEVDFEMIHGLLEFKCLSTEEFEEGWLQVMVYNLISSSGDDPKYRHIYIYNAISGVLYKRKFI